MPDWSHNRRAAPGGPMLYLMQHKFTISQSPYIYLYLLKFFSFLFILHKQRKKNNRRTPIPLNSHRNNVACEFPKPGKTLHNPAFFLKQRRIFFHGGGSVRPVKLPSFVYQYQIFMQEIIREEKETCFL
jgi:hypothetical protein